MLGDNIFHGHEFGKQTKKAAERNKGATIFAYAVNDPQRYGVVEFDKKNKVKNIVEKPAHPRSRYAVVGLYFYDNRVVGIAEKLKPSTRGELEITDVNRIYLEWGELDVIPLGRGHAWLDAGTHESLLEASHFVETIERRQGWKIACPEEIARNMKYISPTQFRVLAERCPKSSYGEYLQRLVAERVLK